MRKTSKKIVEHSPAVFLDRDGTFLDETGYLGDPDKVRFLPGAVDAMRELSEAGFRLIVVTNQSGIGRGFFSEEQALAVNLKMIRMLSDKGVPIDAIYYCPHHPDDGCECRKPQTMMVKRAEDDFDFDTKLSWVVGDVDKDVHLGLNSGLRPVLVATGKTEKGDIPRNVTTKPDLEAAARMIQEKRD
jgi:histidinol-phosphate phosphatase family protein